MRWTNSVNIVSRLAQPAEHGFRVIIECLADCQLNLASARLIATRPAVAKI
jgi:hypothetical protein